VLLIFLAVSVLAQTDSVFYLKTLQSPILTKSVTPGLSIDRCWKYKKGDNQQWADTNFDSKDWKYSSTALVLSKLPEGYFDNCGWFRLRIHVDSTLLNQPLALMFNQIGATEVYLDGKLIIKIGKIHPTDISKDELISPSFEPHAIVFTGGNQHLIAVRYHNKDALKDYQSQLIEVTGFEMKIGEFDKVISFLKNDGFFFKGVMVFYFAFFLALAILHILLFSFYPKNKSNLYYSGFALFFGFIFLAQALLQITDDPLVIKDVLRFGPYLPLFYASSLLAMLYTIFYKKILKVLWLWITLMIIYLVSYEMHYTIKFLNQLLTAFICN